MDEIDPLVGDALLPVLRQLRAGYEQRAERFARSVAPCWAGNVRLYRIRSNSREIVAGGKPFKWP